LSADGTQLAFISFPHTSDQIHAPGRLLIRQMDVSDRVQHVVSGSASYYVPSWSPDGTKIAVVRQAGTQSDAKAEFGWIDAVSETFHAVAPATPFTKQDPRFSFGQHIYFSEDGTQLVFQPGEWLYSSLHAVNLDGSGERVLATASADDVCGIFPSPDLSRALVVGWDLNPYLVSLPRGTSQPIELSAPVHGSANVERIQIGEGGTLYPNWANNKSVTYGWANRIFRYDVDDASPTLVEQVTLEVPRHGINGTVAFRNARLIIMDGARGSGTVIEKGTIVVRGRRIEAVGPADSVAIPPGSKIVDSTGLTIMPGFVDSHSHGLAGHPFASQISIPIGLESNIPSALAYGVTTAWEAMGTQDDGNLSEIELREAGRLIGQRWLTAGGILNHDGENSYRGPEDVRARVRKKIALGGEQCLKSRQEEVRTVVQWYADEARKAHVCLVAHTETMDELLAWAGDGLMVDHPSVAFSAYGDVLQFLLGTGVIWTPHVFMSASTRSAQAVVNGLFLRELRVRGDDAQLRKLERFGPSALEHYERLPDIPFERTATAREAKVVRAFVAAGGKIAVSSDGGIGIENHFEMWALNRAGISPADVLRAATINGAEKLGIDDDVGSLTVGKLADLIILTANPLEKIENSLLLKYTVLDGVIYDSNTLDIVSPPRVGN
jgi:hypothetical protein